MLNDLLRVSSHSVTQHSTDTQQADESSTFQNYMGETGSYLRRTAHCGLLHSFSKQISLQYLDNVITASSQLLPHPSLTKHTIVRHYSVFRMRCAEHRDDI
jgi:hypothetical protein